MIGVIKERKKKVVSTCRSSVSGSKLSTGLDARARREVWKILSIVCVLLSIKWFKWE